MVPSVCCTFRCRDTFDFLWFYCWCVTLLLQVGYFKCKQFLKCSNFLLFSCFRCYCLASSIVLHFLCPVMIVHCRCLKRRAQSKARRVWNEVKKRLALARLESHIRNRHNVIRSFLSRCQQRCFIAFHIPFDLEGFSSISLCMFHSFFYWQNLFSEQVNGHFFFYQQTTTNPISHKCEHISSLYFV